MSKDAKLSASALSSFESALAYSYEVFEGLGFCLSEDGDLLSQWRGYADDGHGISIGFDPRYLEALGTLRRGRDERNFTLKKLIYDEHSQAEIAKEHFDKLSELITKGALSSTVGSILFPVDDARKEEIKKLTLAAHFEILHAMLRMFEFKNPAFSEEREWRLIGYTTKGSEESGTMFRATRGTIIPYLQVQMEDAGIAPIVQVTLGPKHQTPVHVIEQLLKTTGFGSVEVSRSKATYR